MDKPVARNSTPRSPGKQAMERNILKSILPDESDPMVFNRAFKGYFGYSQCRAIDPSDIQGIPRQRLSELTFPYMYQYGLLRAARSQAFLEYCRQVHGMAVPQFNMVSPDEHQALLSLLRQYRGGACLDAGCGIGALTRYWKSLVPGNYHGVDRSETAIQYARDRLSVPGLQYHVADLTALTGLGVNFDVIVALECLGGAPDLTGIIDSFRAVSNPGAHWYIAWSCMSHGVDVGSFDFRNTRLGKALDSRALVWMAIDQTPQEKKFWELTETSLGDLRTGCLLENNQFLWWLTVDEFEAMESQLSRGYHFHRGLFVVEP